MKRQIIFLILCLLEFIILVSCSTDVASGLGLKHEKKPIIPTASVNINLSTSNSGSVNGASVMLQNNADSSIVFNAIAANNTVAFLRVPYGVYTLTITHTGFETLTINNVSVQSATVNPSAILIALTHYATVNISLSTNNSGSVNGAFVRLQNNGNSTIQFNTSATSNIVTFVNVPYGTYTLTITHVGYESFTNNNVSVQSATVNPSANLLAIIHYATVNVSLSTNNNGSVNGALVKLENNSNSSIVFTTTAVNSTVSFDNVPYGTYTLTISHTGYETFANNNISVQSSTVNPLASLIAIIQYSTVTVNLSTNDSGSVTGASVRLQNNSESSIFFNTNSTSNTVTFANVPYGTYTLTISLTGYQPFNNSNVSVQAGNVNSPAVLQAYTISSLGPAGGRIFYDKGFHSNGWRYLEAAPSNQISTDWGTFGHDIFWTQFSIGSGPRNTELILERLVQLGETGKAAQIANSLNLNGFNDWFLPSRDELNQMYQQRLVIGEFFTINYWSSSQANSNSAMSQNFLNGQQSNSIKNSQIRVRAIRAF